MDRHARKDGRWGYRWHNAKGERQYGYARSEAEAERKLREAVTDRDRGIPTPSTRHTVGTWMTRWLEGIPEGAVRSTTRARYEWIAARWKADPIAKVRLTTLQPAHIAGALGRLEAAGLSPRSQAYLVRGLGRALQVAVRDGHVGRNVARAPYAPPLPQVDRRSAGAPPNTMDLSRMRAGIAQSDLEALWTLCLDAGLRLGEALALRWADVDLGAGVVHVNGTAISGSATVVHRPKTNAGRRSLPVDPHVTDALRRHRARGYPGSLSPMPSAYLFPWGPLGHLTHHQARWWWRKLCRQQGAAHCRVHDLRHSFAQRWIAAGKPLAILSRYLGHASIGVTVDIYGHPDLVAPGLWVAPAQVQA